MLSTTEDTASTEESNAVSFCEVIPETYSFLSVASASLLSSVFSVVRITRRRSPPAGCEDRQS